MSPDPITDALNAVHHAEDAHRQALVELDRRRCTLDAALVHLRHTAGSPGRPAGPDRLAALLGGGWTRSRVQRRLDRATKPTPGRSAVDLGSMGESDGG
jgi:hypothetical protein